MNGFGWVLDQLQYNSRVARTGWNGSGMYLTLVMPSTYYGGFLLEPYIGLKTVDNKLVPWCPSQTDLLARDWNYAY